MGAAAPKVKQKTSGLTHSASSPTMQAMSTITIDAWIRGRRAERDESQDVAAEALGVTVRTLGAWERGEPPIKVEHLRALAAWGGCDAADLIAMIPVRARTA